MGKKVKYRDIIKSLVKLTFVMLLVLGILSFFPFATLHFVMAFGSMVVVSLFLTLFSGWYNSRSIKKPFFLNIFFATLGMKFLFATIFIGLFYYAFRPDEKLLVLMVGILSIYKMYESILLVRMSRDLGDAQLKNKR